MAKYTEEQLSQIAEYKERLDVMGIPYPATGAPELYAALVNKALGTDEPVAATKAEASVKSVKAAALKPVRVRVTCLNPSKKDLRGEWVCAGNSVIGSQKVFVPYNEAANEWVLPRIIVDVLKGRQYLRPIKSGSKVGALQRSVFTPEFDVVELA